MIEKIKRTISIFLAGIITGLIIAIKLFGKTDTVVKKLKIKGSSVKEIKIDK